MSQEERFGTRDLSYSAWHRRNSIRRYVGIETANLLAMIDLDAALYVEFDNGTKEPLALIETAQDTGQPYKSATVTQRLAILANLPCYLVLYRLTDKLNEADPLCCDIDQFRVMRLNPNEETEWRILSPKEWAKGLVSLRKWKTKAIDLEWDSSH